MEDFVIVKTKFFLKVSEAIIKVLFTIIDRDKRDDEIDEGLQWTITFFNLYICFNILVFILAIIHITIFPLFC